MLILFSYVFLFPVSNNSFTQMYNISTGLNTWEGLCVDLWNSLSMQPLPVLHSGFQTWDTLFSSLQWMFRLCISSLCTGAWKSSQWNKAQTIPMHTSLFFILIKDHSSSLITVLKTTGLHILSDFHLFRVKGWISSPLLHFWGEAKINGIFKARRNTCSFVIVSLYFSVILWITSYFTRSLK